MTKAAVFCLAAGLASAQTASLTVNTGNVLHTVDPKIYGQSLEHDYHSVNGGVLEATGGNDESRFSFGAETWRDYDLTVDVMRPAGNGVLSVAVRSYGHSNHALSLGGAGGFELARTEAGPQLETTK